MTLIVLLLGLPFLVATVQGLLYATEQSNLRERKSIAKRAFNRLSRELKGTNPKGRVKDLYEQSGLDSLGAGASLVDRSGKVLWESPHRSPRNAQRGVQQLMLDEGALLFVMPEKPPDSRLQNSVFAIGGLALFGYCLSAWLLVGATLRPISKLVQRVKEVESGEIRVISSPTTDREVVDLVETLNNLISKVQAESTERVNAYATLSHELRTPIHSLLLKLDLALSHEKEKEELEGTLLEVQSQVYRLQHLSDAVLTLQRLSHSENRDFKEPINRQEIAPMLESLLVEIQPLMDIRNLSVSMTVSKDIGVIVQEQHLQLLLRNLLENSAKHSTLGSVIEIKGEELQDYSRLTFSNQANEKKHLAGNGLGLRICLEVARVNGWILTTEEVNELHVAEVRFPRIPTS